MITDFLNQQLLPWAVFFVQAEGEAAGQGGGAGGAGQGGGQPPMFPPQMMLFMVGLFAIFYFMIMRPQQKEAKRRAAMLDALKKNDKVVSAGGIIGTIADISPDGKRVTVKVDDNTRVKFLRSSIQGLYEDSGETAGGAQS